jgi:hypothetical protein
MTDNEKAATFIGWKPNEKCNLTLVTCMHFDQPWFDRESEESKRWVKEGGQYPPFAEHPIPAPDMTDPRNYMKAWHGYSAKFPYRRIVVETNTGIKPTWRFKVWIEDTIGQGMLTNCYPVDDIGVGIVKAIAALYDAEQSVNTAVTT